MWNPARLVVILSFAIVCAAGQAAAYRGTPPISFSAGVVDLSQVEAVVMPAVDVESYLAEDAAAQSSGEPVPLRFAAAHPVTITPPSLGTWETLPGGARIWRVRITSTGAASLNFGFTTYQLPEGAMLHVYPETGTTYEGPYTSRHNELGQLWTPVVPGDAAVVELYLPAGSEAQLVLGRVNHDYRGVAGTGNSKAAMPGPCNNDVVCPEADPWRDEIRSVARFSVDGVLLCTGQLVNNTAVDGTPYFLTANHCAGDPASPATMVMYWNYESPTCGQLCCGALNDNQSGALPVSTDINTDYSLVELLDVPDPSSNVYYAGWDARETHIPQECTAIHHPNGDPKTISFNFDELRITSEGGFAEPGDGRFSRVTEWEDGTTEPGSSGSGIWDADHHLVGQLCCGTASCSSISSDWYGRFSRSWTGGGTILNSLAPHLDPDDTGILVLDGWDPSGTGVAGGGSSPAGPTRLERVLPNPARTGDVRFRFNLSEPGSVRLTIADATGRVVALLPGGTYASGAWELAWDRKGADHRIVSPGVYFAQLRIDGRAAGARKLVVLGR